jgi:hypothetical protein
VRSGVSGRSVRLGSADVESRSLTPIAAGRRLRVRILPRATLTQPVVQLVVRRALVGLAARDQVGLVCRPERR